MNKTCFIVLCLIAVLSIVSCSSTSEKLVIQNNRFTKTFTFETQKAGKIGVQYFFSELDKEIVSSDKSPYFEFVLDGNIINSNQKLWQFGGSKQRQMLNGGTEYVITFEGIKQPVRGLEVIVYQQVFKNSTLIREKLELHASNKSFALNKLDNDLHFKFPCYSIKKLKSDSCRLSEFRMATFEKKPITFGNRKKGNHMYYPDVLTYKPEGGTQLVKGPLAIVSTPELSWLCAYEHASQDNLNGMFDKQKLGQGNLINDAMQGTKGVFNFPISASDFKFLGIAAKNDEKHITVSIDALRGAYLDGEIVDKNHPYSTVWMATGFYSGNNMEDGKAMIRNYLFNQICEKPASRKPEFYYNTWGMQRNDKTKPLRGILSYQRIFEEIEYAAELGVDIFVLDDGWQETQGIWYPNKKRFPQGLAPIKKRLDKYGIKLGLWYSPMGIDSTTERYKKHPDWVIKDSENNPIMAQWNHPAFDFVGPFFDVFINDCKNMIDQGCRFMKWDAINTFYSTLPNLYHGSGKYSAEEIRARYEYLLPIYVVKAMEILTDYEPELIIEVDLTEARRVMVGLAPLSQGKLFWMNNGASWYNDYTTFRTKSMRTIANEFAGFIPLELFTYANYPHNITGNMKYNVANSLLAGHGFWGNLKLMNTAERKWIGRQVKHSKNVLPYLTDVNPNVVGKVGDSPEIYSIVNTRESAGQLIVFSENPIETEIKTKISTSNLLVVLNTKYVVENNILKTPVGFDKKESSLAIIILPNKGSGVSVVSSDSEISDAELNNGELTYSVSNPGKQVINWDKKFGKPKLVSSGAKMSITEKQNHFELQITVKNKNTIVRIS